MEDGGTTGVSSPEPRQGRAHRQATFAAEPDKMSHQPFFLITIDTEGDNIWANPHVVETKNAEYLPRFQSLCERYGFKPTWLTNYEMAVNDTYVSFARDVLARKAGEVGMHLHAWNSPPVVPLGDGTGGPHPYLTEFPDSVMRDKVLFIHDLLEETFGVKMQSHRGGRWALDARYVRILMESGYAVDCTITPGHSWRRHPGGFAPGPDYADFGPLPYWMDPEDIQRSEGAGSRGSRLLEVPMTILAPPLASIRRRFPQDGLPGRIINRILPRLWLRPNGRNLNRMKRVIDRRLLRFR